MKMNFFTVMIVGLAITTGSLYAQHHASDKYPPLKSNDLFDVNLPYPVTLGKHVLQPGNYRMEPLDLAGGDAPVLVIRGDNDTKLNIAARVTPTFADNAPPETRVSLYHIGNSYYFDTISVQGLNYGFRFRLPKNMRGRAAQRVVVPGPAR